MILRNRAAFPSNLVIPITIRLLVNPDKTVHDLPDKVREYWNNDPLWDEIKKILEFEKHCTVAKIIGNGAQVIHRILMLLPLMIYISRWVFTFQC